MRYCEACKTAFEGARYPTCGNADARAARDGDECFLTEQDMIFGEMLADVLKQNGVPFYYKPMLGAGLTMKVGLYKERYRFFVPYEHFAQAQQVLDALFPPAGETEQAPEQI